jgi:hypothetical protein
VTELNKARRTLYQSIVGSIMWAAMSVRPDLAFIAGYLSRFSSNPSEEHLKAAKRALAYIKGSKGLTLLLGNASKDQDRLIGYSDSDYEGDLETRRSTTGHCFKFRGSRISWGSTRQSTVATSTCEAEYMALTEATKEVIWLCRMLEEMNVKVTKPITLCCDNQGALALAANPGRHKRTKHIDIRYHYIRECVELELVVLKHVGTNDQAADALTKALQATKHEHACSQLNLV